MIARIACFFYTNQIQKIARRVLFVNQWADCILWLFCCCFIRVIMRGAGSERVRVLHGYTFFSQICYFYVDLWT